VARILVADDEPGLREFISDSLELDDHAVVPAKDGREAAKLLDERGFDLVITDLKMPGLGGMDLLRKVRAEQPEVEVIMMTAHGTVDNAVEAMKLGAFEYLQKPLSGPDELRLLVGRALERRGLRDQVDGAGRHTERSGPPLTYGDPAMRPVVWVCAKPDRASSVLRQALQRTPTFPRSDMVSPIWVVLSLECQNEPAASHFTGSAHCISSYSSRKFARLLSSLRKVHAANKILKSSI